MLLRTVRMRSVHIDPAARTERAEAGALWQDVTVPAGQHGLAALAGTSPNVGVTGYTLGGGLGWLARRYGLGRQQRHGGQTRDPGRPAHPGRRWPGPPGGESQKIDFSAVSPTALSPTRVTARDHCAQKW